MVLNSNSFQNVSDSAGIIWSRQRGTEAFSVAWVDFNNNGLLDLWVSGHGYNNASPQYPDGKFPYLYINNGDGTFSNLFDTDWRRGVGGDIHGTTWADFDNDGDQDVIVAAGGALGDIDINGENINQTNKLFVNRNGNLNNEAGLRGIENAIARTRSSLWFDANNDGLLDFVSLPAIRDDVLSNPAYYEQQEDGTFIDRTAAVGFNINESSRYAQLADLTGDGKLDLVVHGTYSWPLGVFDFSGYSTGESETFEDITSTVGITQLSDFPPDRTQDFVDHSSARDSIIADFNNDGRNDIFLTRSRIFTTEPVIFQGSDNIVSADLILQTNGEIGITFKTTGILAFDSFTFNAQDLLELPQQQRVGASDIFIGESGRNPTPAELNAIFGTSYDPTLTSGADGSPNTNVDSAAFELNPADPSVQGIKEDRTTRGIYIGYNSESNDWEIRFSSPNSELIRIAVESTEAITELTEINFTSADPDSLGLRDRFLVYDPDTETYVENTVNAGFEDTTLANSAVAGDFDNDMDLDIYIANAYPSFDRPNILYENQGDGSFIAVEAAGGADTTPVGPHRLDFEVGQRIAVADYDGDGFLDIFAGSTTARSPRKTYLGTPSQLYQNQEAANGNTNNWLQIDLEGTKSNRDAIGSRVLVTTPDGITQVREQNNGTHSFAQNSSRLHFGLGENTSISEITIEWTSGEIQTITDGIDINQIITITEPITTGEILGTEEADLLSGTGDPETIVGLAGNDTLEGLAGKDTIVGGEGDDSIEGNSGNDSIEGGEGSDTIKGGENNDNINGGYDNDELIGNNGEDVINGDAGDDLITGNAGFDTLFGGLDNDTIFGNDGNDSISGGDQGDELQGNDGDDTLRGDPGFDTLLGGEGNDDLNGNDGNDTVDGETGNDTVFGGNGNDLLFGGNGMDSLRGGIGQDTLEGGDRDDTLNGGLAQDELDGGGGNDQLLGGGGKDTLRGGNGDDTLNGGARRDRVIESGNSDFLITDTEMIGRGNDTLISIELVQVAGGGSDNTLDASTVTQFEVLLNGLGGNDTVLGGANADRLTGGGGSDSLTGNDGNDILDGGDGNDTLNGNRDRDSLTGGAGNDILSGDEGNDTLSGGLAVDVLTGGSGNDDFVYFARNEGGDIINDFQPARDTFVISASGFDTDLTPGILDSSQFVLGSNALDADDRFIYSNNRLFFDANGSGSNQKFLIATLSGGPNITSNNIEIIA